MKRTDWILTYTGRQFWPLEPEAADVCIEDIAHALAMKCRFGGHCRSFYSVAQHSVLCSEYVAAFGGSPALQMAALLHDAGEAYLPDVVSPLKRFIQVKELGPKPFPFSVIEEVLCWTIFNGLLLIGVGDFQSLFRDPLIKEADRVMLMTERRDLLPPSAPWKVEVPRLWNTINEENPWAAERRPPGGVQ